MAKPTIYTVGGTVQAGGGIYIKRKADDELLELCKQGELAFILSSRQVGKSSLMVRTAQKLKKENIYSVTIDLSAIGVKVSSDEWYLGILNEIGTSLELETNIFNWWSQYAQLGPAQRLTNFFRDVLLQEVKERIVLFFDEIDSTLSIPFSDDFYVAVRAVYNARSTTPDFKRLSFVLIGVATPNDLIADNKRTPFNIGHRVEINDFTQAEALPLTQGLGAQAEQVLAGVFQFTGGHPYLTQRLCAYLANSKESLDEHVVANAVEQLFTGEQGKQDNNLQFVRDMLAGRSPDVARVMLIYRNIRSGMKVVDDERSITKAHLKLSGLVRSERGLLRVRNEIYNRVFNLRWVQENTPKNWQKAALISLSTVLGILVLTVLAVFTHDYLIGTRIDRNVTHFYFAKSPQERIPDLAEIYRQKGILQEKDSDFTASQLFYGLPSAKDQLDLFTFDPYHMPPDPDWQNDLVVVISHLYITVANIDPEEDTTELLQTMRAALDNISNNADALRINKEIIAWIAGRKSFSSGDFEGALRNYNKALSLNSGNQAMLYERAKVYVALKQYTNALNDLEATISAAKQSAPDIVTPVPTTSSVPVSAIPNIVEVQTKESGFPLPEPTSLSTQINKIPTEGITPTLELTPTIGATPTSMNTSPKKYESNFTTLIDVVNAVRTLIENTPQLQIAMQSNEQNVYTNLHSFGFIPIVPTPKERVTPDIILFGSTTFSWRPGDSAINAYDLTSPSGALTITAGGRTDQWAEVDSAPLVFYRIDGNFETQVKLVFNPILGHELAGIGVRSAEDRNTWLRIGKVYGIFSAGSKPEQLIVLDTDKHGMGAKLSTSPYPDDTVYLKLERQGSAFAFFYSPNGSKWTTLQSNYVADMPANLEIFLVVGSWGDGNTAANFYDFKVLRK